ncbi:MAG: hypothetical protein Q9186_006927 [Xanthomendoza sp. 1 TL-2023]
MKLLISSALLLALVTASPTLNQHRDPTPAVEIDITLNVNGEVAAAPQPKNGGRFGHNVLQIKQTVVDTCARKGGM